MSLIVHAEQNQQKQHVNLMCLLMTLNINLPLGSSSTVLYLQAFQILSISEYTYLLNFFQ